jgi:hypothetical protein
LHQQPKGLDEWRQTSETLKAEMLKIQKA